MLFLCKKHDITKRYILKIENGAKKRLIHLSSMYVNLEDRAKHVIEGSWCSADSSMANSQLFEFASISRLWKRRMLIIKNLNLRIQRVVVMGTFGRKRS